MFARQQDTTAPTASRNCTHAGVCKAVSLSLSLILVACSDNRSVSAARTTLAPVEPSAEATRLQQENQRLQGEVQTLKQQVEDLRQTPQVLFERVHAAVKGEQMAQAETWADKLEQRYGASPQSKAARAVIAHLQVTLGAREEQARRLEAMGFYALKPTSAAKVGAFVIKVESLSLADRWLFDSQGDTYHYRDVRRGEKFVRLKTVLQSTDKSQDPDLPDVAVFRIEGKTMSRVAPLNYEFRQWSSYGTFIGLHHDFKNDFAHSSSIPFNAAASIDEAVAKTPFAVVVTGNMCHERTKKIGQPEIEYRYRSQCGAKATLSAEDFNGGNHQVLAFFNKPKGT